jgi:hypothetical protein
VASNCRLLWRHVCPCTANDGRVQTSRQLVDTSTISLDEDNTVVIPSTITFSSVAASANHGIELSLPPYRSKCSNNYRRNYWRNDKRN